MQYKPRIKYIYIYTSRWQDVLGI